MLKKGFVLILLVVFGTILALFVKDYSTNNIESTLFTDPLIGWEPKQGRKVSETKKVGGLQKTFLIPKQQIALEIGNLQRAAAQHRWRSVRLDNLLSGNKVYAGQRWTFKIKVDKNKSMLTVVFQSSSNHSF